VEYALALFVLVVVVGLIVARPLLRGAAEPGDDAEREELEAAKEAKYREIRDAELDFRMGKLSEEDFRLTDSELRAQAIEILKKLDALRR
jgi:hypothetical protein